MGVVGETRKRYPKMTEDPILPKMTEYPHDRSRGKIPTAQLQRDITLVTKSHLTNTIVLRGYPDDQAQLEPSIAVLPE